MKKQYFLLVILIILSVLVKSQTYGFDVELKNFEQVDETTIEWDIYVKKASGTSDFALWQMQIRLEFNNDILNSGNFTNASFTIAEVGENMNQNSLFFIDEDCTVVGSNPNIELNWAVSNPPASGQSMTIISDTWLKVARFSAQLQSGGNPHNFSSDDPEFAFQSSGAQVLIRRSINTSTTYDGSGSTPVPRNNTIPDLGVKVNDAQLAGYCFTETGNWTNNDNWNNALASDHGAYHQNPGTSSNNNVLIKGNVTVNSDVSLSQSSGNGGELIVETGEIPTFTIELVPNGSSVSVTLYASDQLTILSNPLSNVEAGTQFYFWTSGPPPAGTFTNWTDQNSNVIGTSAWYGPYTMPSSDMTITANWTSGTKGLVSATNKNYSRDDLYSSLTIASDASLTVENLYNNHSSGAEAIILKSDATGTASLIHNNTGVNATIERYINDWTQEEKGWHFISSPVSAQDIQPEFIPNDLPSWADLYKWDESWEQEGTYGWWINIKDDDGSLNSDFADTEFALGGGYMIAYESPNGDIARKFTGEINVENVALTGLTHTSDAYNNGWHLVGNPFASSIKWNEGSWVKSHIGNIPQIWDESAASYELIDNIGGDGYIIPPHNGFMVYVSPPNGNLTIPEDARVHGDQNWYKSGEEDVFQLIAYDLDKNIWQQTSVRENIDATEDFDLEYDSYFIAGYAPMFYSVSGESCLALNTLPEINETTVIPLSFVKNTSENFNIELTEAPEQIDVFLTDLKLDIVTNLRNNPEYAFTAEEGDDPNRFLLSFSLVNIDENGFDANFNTWFSDNKLYIRSMLNVNNQLRIFDSKGQLLDQKQFNGEGLHTYHVDLPTGVYIGRLANEKGNCSIKFFVIR